jgi:hypothetical protein
MSMTISMMIFKSKINYDQDADIFTVFNLFNLEQKHWIWIYVNQ